MRKIDLAWSATVFAASLFAHLWIIGGVAPVVSELRLEERLVVGKEAARIVIGRQDSNEWGLQVGKHFRLVLDDKGAPRMDLSDAKGGHLSLTPSALEITTEGEASCVVGVQSTDGGWLRLVGNKGEVTMRASDGASLELLSKGESPGRASFLANSDTSRLVLRHYKSPEVVLRTAHRPPGHPKGELGEASLQIRHAKAKSPSLGVWLGVSSYTSPALMMQDAQGRRRLQLLYDARQEAAEIRLFDKSGKPAWEVVR